ncbi:MAG: UDP-N-acetylmuramoyl-L-alanyl-D-glutamate--2,6-diaminopimelate ligase [Bacillota bacterium]
MKKLDSLLTGLDFEVLQGELETKIAGIAYDSREVQENYLFVCIEGFTHDGHDFITEAVANGANSILVTRDIDLSSEITVIKVSDTRSSLAKVSSAFYDYPSQQLTVVGVTGTNGKTTNTYLIDSILEEAGHQTGLIGTIKNKIGERTFDSQRTTPEALDIASLLAEMVEEGVTHVVMEVSSHALDLQRVAGVDFDVAIFTNITQDHLDFHESFADYLAAKQKLFTNFDGADKTAIINIDDPNSDQFISVTEGEIITYSIEKDANLRATEITVNPTGVEFVADTMKGKIELDLNITGLFNVYNTLSAIGAALSLKISPQDIKSGLEQVQGVAGRFEIIEGTTDFGVIVDYAHTPDSLRNILETAQDFVEGRIIVVFGCGGDRDRDKRPIMGQVATTLADFAVITSDNPRSEDPKEIIADIQAGIEAEGKIEGVDEDYVIIEDRAQAIDYGIQQAESDDLVFIVGKGHENYQTFKDKTVPFDDREVARESLAKVRGE